MASFMAKLRGGADPESDPAVQQERDKYRLLVTAGPAYDRSSHKIVRVNTEIPTMIENEFLRAKIVVRVKGFRGLPSSSPGTAEEYFADPMHSRDQYSLGFSFVPKQDIPSVDTVWGNDFDHPVRDRIPPGFNTAFRIVKEFVDPGLSCDAYADEPWLYGPSLSCWFALRIGEMIKEGEDFPSPGVMHEGADGTGQYLRDKLGLPSDNEKRRKFFLDAKNRQSFVFEKGRVYGGDFYNPYLDFGNFMLKLPGFSLKVIKYVGDKTHCLRYVFKNPKTGEMYFNVNFTLLWGEELKNALEKDGSDTNQQLVVPEADTQTTDVKADGLDQKDTSSTSQASQQDTKSHSQAPQQGNVQRSSVEAATSPTTPTTMQLHPGDHNATAESIVSHSTLQVTLAGSTGMQLHPGDHNAAADRMSTTVDPPVDEIARLLQQTSTSQQRGGRFLDDVD